MLKRTRLFRFIPDTPRTPPTPQAPPTQTSTISLRLCGFVNNWERLRGCHDICFYYPRFSMETHLDDSLPELTAAKKTLFEADAAGDSVDSLRRKVRDLLGRANDVFNSACGGDLLATTGAAPAIRGHAIAVAAATAVTEETVRTAATDYKLCVALAPAVRAIALDATTHSKMNGFDAACCVVAAYTRAMTNQLWRGQWHNVAELSRITGVATNAAAELPQPKEVVEAVEALQVSCMSLAAGTTAADSDGGRGGGGGALTSLRSAYNKLTALAALLQVEHNNDAASAIELLTPLQRLKGSNEIEKWLIETTRCELMRRAYGHAYGADAVDSEVESSFLRVQDFWTQFFDTSKPEGAVSMDAGQKIPVRDAYSMFLISQAAIYMEMPRAAAGPRWAKGSRLFQSPFVNVPCAATDPSQIITAKTTGQKLPCSTARAHKLATAYADRSLRINRKIFPEKRDNARAAAALRALAICFSDVGDYLYASGMFNSALRTYEALYGKLSEEYIEVQHRSHDMQIVLKNEKEATATGHLLEQLKAEFAEKHGCPCYVE